MVAKFADHLPLYRQEKIFGRAGLPIARSTLAQWVGNCGVQLQPLVDALREAVRRRVTKRVLRLNRELFDDRRASTLGKKKCGFGPRPLAVQARCGSTVSECNGRSSKVKGNRAHDGSFE